MVARFELGTCGTQSEHVSSQYDYMYLRINVKIKRKVRPLTPTFLLYHIWDMACRFQNRKIGSVIYSSECWFCPSSLFIFYWLLDGLYPDNSAIKERFKEFLDQKPADRFLRSFFWDKDGMTQRYSNMAKAYY